MFILCLFMCSAIRTAIAVIKTACLFLNESCSVFVGKYFFNFIKNKVPFINLLTNLIYISIWIYGFVNLMSMGKITKEKY